MASGFSVTPLDALSDNYMYLIVDNVSKEAAVVDAVEPQKALKAAQDVGATIKFVLTTHHHFDHAGGNKEFKELVPDAEVIGGEDVQAMTRKVKDGEILSLGGLEVKCVHTPAHTNGHTSYLVTGGGEQDGSLFTGDSLFVGGCGRFFEGTPEQMLATTAKFASLPHGTKVYCGHGEAAAPNQPAHTARARPPHAQSPCESEPRALHPNWRSVRHCLATSLARIRTCANMYMHMYMHMYMDMRMSMWLPSCLRMCCLGWMLPLPFSQSTPSRTFSSHCMWSRRTRRPSAKSCGRRTCRPRASLPSPRPLATSWSTTRSCACGSRRCASTWAAAPTTSTSCAS